MLLNLLHHALRSSSLHDAPPSPPPVLLRVTAASSPACLRFEVCHVGPALTEEQQARLFEPAMEGDKGEGGGRLALYVAKILTDLQVRRPP